MGRVVLVTGVARQLGARAAALLAADPEVDRVVGVDIVPPRTDLGAADFERADIRSPAIAKVLSKVGADTVVHMNVLATPTAVGGRAPQKEINVIGTMQLLAACQRTPKLRSLVVKSSTSVYGASPRDPAMFSEDMPAKAPPRSGYAKDTVEVEHYIRGFARRRPDVAVTTLRFANFVGPTVRTPFTEYFALPLVPTVLGFDARLQFIHEDDGMEAIAVAVRRRRAGTFNIAGPGVIGLNQAVHMAGRVPVPVPGLAASGLGSAFRRTGLADFSPEQVRLLMFGRVVDTSRAAEQLVFTPRHTTRQAFEAFVAARCRGGALDAGRVAAAEQTFVAATTRGRVHA
jgi:UDP-glucose 4-epimerase